MGEEKTGQQFTAKEWFERWKPCSCGSHYCPVDRDDAPTENDFRKHDERLADRNADKANELDEIKADDRRQAKADSILGTDWIAGEPKGVD